MTSGVLSSILMLGAGICSGAGSAAGTCSHSGMGSELQQAQTAHYSREQQDAYSSTDGTADSTCNLLPCTGKQRRRPGTC